MSARLEEVVALLRAHVCADDREHADRCAMLRLAEELADPLSREEPTGHFTASAIVVDEAGARTAFVHHAKSGSWLQPGGHIEPEDASASAAALREAREETGLDVRAHPAGLLDVDVHWIRWDGHNHLDLRFLVVASGELAHQVEEVHDARWLTWDEAFGVVREEPLRRALAKARSIAAG